MGTPLGLSIYRIATWSLWETLSAFSAQTGMFARDVVIFGTTEIKWKLLKYTGVILGSWKIKWKLLKYIGVIPG